VRGSAEAPCTGSAPKQPLAGLALAPCIISMPISCRPAHWLMPDYSICWPMGGEIDILERINTVQMVHGALHWNTEKCYVPVSAGGWSPTLPFDPSADFHTYGIVWNATTDRIDYYIDELVYTNAVSVSTKFPQKPFHIILNTVRAPVASPLSRCVGRFVCFFTSLPVCLPARRLLVARGRVRPMLPPFGRSTTLSITCATTSGLELHSLPML